MLVVAYKDKAVMHGPFIQGQDQLQHGTSYGELHSIQYRLYNLRISFFCLPRMVRRTAIHLTLNEPRPRLSKLAPVLIFRLQLHHQNYRCLSLVIFSSIAVLVMELM